MHLLIALALSTLFALWNPVPVVFDMIERPAVQVATAPAPALVLAQ